MKFWQTDRFYRFIISVLMKTDPIGFEVFSVKKNLKKSTKIIHIVITDLLTL
jgi:hypothetical protein